MNTCISPNHIIVDAKSKKLFCILLTRFYILRVICCNLTSFIQKVVGKAVKFMLMMFLLSGSLSALGQPNDTPKQHCRVCLPEHFEPYAFVNVDKNPDGLVVDLLHEIEKSTNFTFEIIPMTYKGMILALDSAKVDIICLVNTPDKSQRYNFSTPLCEIKQAIYQKGGTRKSIQLNTLTGHKIGFIEDDALIDTFANCTDFEKVIVLSKLDGFLKLDHNKFEKENKLVLEIIDNGIGFAEKLETKPDAYAFIGMKERAFLLDGELFISSQLGQGTCITVEMPYNPINSES